MTERVVGRVEPATADGTVERTSGLVMTSANRLKLAVFGYNLSGGPAGVTFAEGPPRIANWDEVRSIAVSADEKGLEAVIPIGRWKGFGGPSGFWDRSLETFTWAAATAEATERIQIFTTCHVSVIHPVIAAKMGATIDHVSNGRWGLNVVAGWLGPEFDMFGSELPPHRDRYEMAAEWLEAVTRLWTEVEPFDFNGKFFQLKGAVSIPKPVQNPYPLIMNAGHSPSGRSFAANHCDMIFISLVEQDGLTELVDQIRAEASKAGREVSIWGLAHIVCRDTEEEARAFVERYAVEQGDFETAKRYAVQLLQADTSSHDKFRHDSDLMRTVTATAGNWGVVGSPEQVVSALQKVSESGIDGVGMIFVDNLEGLERYQDQLLPMMREAGLRA
jgi:alkanesulfonate monooxygenase SsuD/methylene tetrahydromethanopterin reductase-like flavin-dependent oxidoreductase (luciferase family)